VDNAPYRVLIATKDVTVIVTLDELFIDPIWA
jgi:hypothetical protein